MTKTIVSNKPNVIALSGYKRSGKDTVAAYLGREYGIRRVAFADPLKEIVGNLFGFRRSEIDDPTLKEAPIVNYPVISTDAFTQHIHNFMRGEFKSSEDNEQFYWTPRALCILIGSTLRSVDSDYWVKRAVRNMVPGETYVITDLRYRSEIKGLEAAGCNIIPVRINRFDKSTSSDPSERDLDNYPFDIVLENKGTVESLYHSVQIILGPILNK